MGKLFILWVKSYTSEDAPSFKYPNSLKRKKPKLKGFTDSQKQLLRGKFPGVRTQKLIQGPGLHLKLAAEFGNVVGIVHVVLVS